MNFLNNTFVTLEAPVSSSDRVIFVKKFIGNLGENFPLSAVLQESDSTGTIIKREIIRITGKNDTMLNVERAVELCPQSDTAERPSQNPLNFSENAVLVHTLTAGDLWKILWKITDVRRIPDIRGINRKPKEYVAQTFYGPEFVQGSVVGIRGANWVNLHTYNPWTSHVYATQTAISAYGALGVWIRKANSEDAWGEWEKIYPLSEIPENITVSWISRDVFWGAWEWAIFLKWKYNVFRLYTDIKRNSNGDYYNYSENTRRVDLWSVKRIKKIYTNCADRIVSNRITIRTGTTTSLEDRLIYRSNISFPGKIKGLTAAPLTDLWVLEVDFDARYIEYDCIFAVEYEENYDGFYKLNKEVIPNISPEIVLNEHLVSENVFLLNQNNWDQISKTPLIRPGFTQRISWIPDGIYKVTDNWTLTLDSQWRYSVMNGIIFTRF